MFKRTRNQPIQASGTHGLVLSDKNDRAEIHQYELLVFSDLIELKARRRLDLKKHNPFVGGKRKPIKRFSRKSRNNLMKKLGKARNTDRGLFVTLTFPDSVLFTVTPTGEVKRLLSIKESKRLLSIFRKRVERLFPTTWTLWRLELVTRKSGCFSGHYAPHFHMLHYGNLHDMAYLRRWFRWNWYEVAHNGDKHLGKAGTQIDTIKNKRHAYKYTSKYLAKETEDDLLAFIEQGNLPGRWWGIFGAYDGEPAYRLTLDHSGFIKIKRIVRGWLNSSSRFYSRKLSRVKHDAGIFCFGLGDKSEGQEFHNLPPPILRAASRELQFLSIY